MAAGFFADLGNTLGSYIPYECPHCKTTRRISEYGGNIITGAICPTCKNDPVPRKVAEYVEEHRHEYEGQHRAQYNVLYDILHEQDDPGELTEEKKKQLTEIAYAFMKSNGELPSKEEISAKAAAVDEAKKSTSN